MKTQLVWIDFDLVLANIATDRSDFANPLDGLQVVFDHEVLQASELRQVHAGFGRNQYIIENLPQACRIGAKLRNNTLRQLRRGGSQLFRNATSCPVKVDLIFERHLHKAVSEHAFPAN